MYGIEKQRERERQRQRETERERGRDRETEGDRESERVTGPAYLMLLYSFEVFNRTQCDVRICARSPEGERISVAPY